MKAREVTLFVGFFVETPHVTLIAAVGYMDVNFGPLWNSNVTYDPNSMTLHHRLNCQIT